MLYMRDKKTRAYADSSAAWTEALRDPQAASFCTRALRGLSQAPADPFAAAAHRLVIFLMRVLCVVPHCSG